MPLDKILEVLTAGAENELDTAFATMARQRIDALVVKADPFFISQRERLVALAGRYAVPAIYPLPEFVKLGGLISYGGNLADSYRQEGIYTGRILKGAKPADLPIQHLKLGRRSYDPMRFAASSCLRHYCRACAKAVHYFKCARTPSGPPARTPFPWRPR